MKAFPLSMLELSTYEASTMELAFMGHNIVLTLDPDTPGRGRRAVR